MHSVCGFIGPALPAGDAAIVVATKPHREKFLAELQGRGLDIETARAQGQLVDLDAAETLARFMVDGRPDSTRFAQTLEPLLARAAEGGRGVRIFGEMVALLWEDGNSQAAIDLEDLWNALAASHPFSLFCAYPLEVVTREGDTAGFRRMCQSHTRVVPTESYSRLADPGDQLYALALLQQEAASGSAEAERLRAQQSHLLAAAREVAAARDEALAATRAKSQFLSAMSQEMRTPANALLSRAAVLLEGPLGQGQRTLLEEVRAAGQALLRIADEIVDYSKLEAEDLELEVGELDLRLLVKAVRELMAEQARARGLELLTHCDPALPLARRGDTLRLRQVLVNLVAKP